MAQFEVDPNSLKSFAAHLGDLSEQANQGIEYLNEWLSIGYFEGRMFVPAVEKISDVREDVDANLRRLASLTSSAAEELVRAASNYETTDRQHAANLDSTYPPA